MTRRTVRPALDALTVTHNARERVKALGGPVAVKNNKYVLSQHVLQFGHYQGQTFKWLLENDLGWATGILSSVLCDGEEERNNPLSQNKFRLLQYVKLYPKVFAIVKTKEAQRRLEKQRSKPQVSMPATVTATATKTSTTLSVEPASVMGDQDLAEAVREIEDLEILSGCKCN
jgi:hypothetical protein